MHNFKYTQIIRICYCHYQNIQTGFPFDFLEKKLEEDGFHRMWDETGFYAQYEKKEFEPNHQSTIVFLRADGNVADYDYIFTND